jgi:hypothetical protein
MDLRSTQLKDTYGNLLTIGTTAGAPTSGTLENGQGADITSLTIAGTADATLKLDSNRNDIIFAEGDTTDNNTLIRQQSSLLRFDTIADDLTTITRRITLDHSTGDISFRDGSANEAFYWDASAGSLGIGTTSPALSIYLDKVLTVGSTGSNEQGGIELLGNQSVDTVVSALTFNNQASGTADKRIAQISANRDGDDNSGSLNFNVWNGVDSTTKAMVIDSSGNVGIGISNPSDYFTNFNDLVVGSTSADSGITIVSSTSDDGTLAFADGTSGTAEYSGYIQYSHANDNLSVGTSGTERMRIDSSGNVGVGETNPSNKLEVNSGSTQTVSIFKASSTSTATNNGGALIGIRNTNDTNGNMEGLFFQNSNGNSTSGIIGYNVNHTTGEGLMTFGVRNSSGTFDEKMRIDSSGNVGIGETNPQAKLHITGRSDTSDITVRIEDTDGSVVVGQDHSNIEYYTTDGASVGAEVKTIYADVLGGLNYAISTRAGGGSLTERMRILSSGGITFNGDTATANALDDYEEGTFTPTLTYATPGTLSVSYNAGQTGGKYTKIGRQVTIELKLVLTAFTKGTASGNLLIGGLPFTSASSTASLGVGSFLSFNYTSGITAEELSLTRAIVLSNDTHIRILRMQADGAFTADDPDADSQFFISATYFV